MYLSSPRILVLYNRYLRSYSAKSDSVLILSIFLISKFAKAANTMVLVNVYIGLLVLTIKLT
jgi:hypothetical protein